MKENSENMSSENEIQKLKDFDVLKGIIKGNIEIDSLDNDTKVRLISMCCDRTKQIEEKIESIKNDKKSLNNN